MDLMLPGEDGLSLTKRIRATTNVSVGYLPDQESWFWVDIPMAEN